MKETMNIKSKSVTTLIALLLLCLQIFALSSCNRTEIVDGIENLPVGTMQISYLTDADNATCVSPYITWTHEEGAEDYVVQIASNADFTDIIESKIVSVNKYSVTTVLNYSTKYYVRIFARKVIDGSKYAFAVVKGDFETTDNHDTTPPDYSATRTLFDFEDYTTESFGELFKPHAGGDTITAEIVDGEGVYGSKALKLTGEKGSMGWSAVACSLLPTDKKVWVGTTAIRLYIRAEEGTSVKFSVKVGKRGYQTWSKSFVVKSTEGAYISIPYEVMADQGGGDGIWDLSIMTFMQFTFSGGGGTVYIDDITIGSTDEYKYDTTAEASKGKVPGILETFEGQDISSKINDNFKFSSVDPEYTTIVESTDGSGSEMKLKLWNDSSMIQINKAPYELTKYDYNQVDGITFKVKLNQVKDGAHVMIKFGSYLNVYTGTYAFDADDAGEYVTVKSPFSELTLAEGSSGDLNFEKIDTLQIFVKGSQYCIFYIDDIGFYKD